METKTESKTYYLPEDLESCTDGRVKIIHQHIQEKIGDAVYPCVGAKASLNSNQYRLGIYGKMGSAETTHQLGTDLKRYTKETLESDSDYMSLIAVFTNEITSEMEFEENLWKQLQKLHESEAPESVWDPTVSRDPEDNEFSFSFAGTAFFIVGLHPASSRKARQINYTAMAFNLHRQFDKLRENDQFENMKNVIRDREMVYNGSINPMLEDFGKGNEAPQYSGRKVEKEWKCPFHHSNENQTANLDDQNH